MFKERERNEVMSTFRKITSAPEVLCHKKWICKDGYIHDRLEDAGEGSYLLFVPDACNDNSYDFTDFIRYFILHEKICGKR